MLSSLTIIFDEFARGGGGGSGGGGGGGGSGGSGGSGGGIGGFFFFLGYVPVLFVVSSLRKIAPRALAIGIGIPLALSLSVLAIKFMHGLGVITAVGAFVGVKGGIDNWFGRAAGVINRAKKQQQAAALKDSAWEETKVAARVQTVFTRFQQDWSTSNFASMQSYLTPHYFGHMQLILKALQQMGRRNDVLQPKLIAQTTSNVLDVENNDQDMLSVSIAASADDQLIDIPTGAVLSRDTSQFYETWEFNRTGNEWILAGIHQATANVWQAVGSLQKFADQHGMFYSLDMGWLLLPQRGQLFSKASFKRSDINNHVIGEWNGHIVQLYTYIPAKATNQAENYLVGQIMLPKSYGGIIIKRRPRFSLFNRIPRGYLEVSLEWPDFNSRYLVYATDMDKVASFELLNPTYMTALYDKNLPVSIEVVDNVVYLYAKVTNAGGRYSEMLDTLQGAFKELRM